MQMRMKQQVLSPAVQHGEEADLRAEVFRIRGDCGQSLGGGRGRESRRPPALFWRAIAAISSGTVKTT